MRTIEVTDRAYELVRFAARLNELSVSEVVERAVSTVLGDGPARPELADPWQPVALYGDYEGVRVEAAYLPATRRVTLTSGPQGGATFKSPSGAARAVVAAINPARASTQTNGWLWWRIAATHERLRVLR